MYCTLLKTEKDNAILSLSHLCFVMDTLLAIFLVPLFFSIIFLYSFLAQRRNSICYMLAYECYKPSDDRKLGTDSCVKIILRNTKLHLEEYRYMLKTITSSGLGEETYCPRNILTGREECPTLNDAVHEMDDIFFSTLDRLFERTGVSPSEIDILIVNVSLFSPMPSLSSRIVNQYKMRNDIKAFNLSGMGCSGSLAAIDLVQRVFKTYQNKYAIVVSTESLGPNWYSGKEKAMMLANCLYRSGGCSMLFTNRRCLKNKAILRLKSLARTHLGSSDEAYWCSIQEDDENGYRGFRLTNSIARVSAKAVAMNLKVLLRRVLPLSELLRYVLVASTRSRLSKIANSSAHGLNLKAGFNHFCIPPISTDVVDAFGKGLGLNDFDLEPTKMALHRFGNTSAGGLWYVLGFMEAKKRLRKGNGILMISFGAGYECNSCMWEVMRDLDDANVWEDCIERYPPETLTNSFMDKYSWINDQCLDFVRLDMDALRAEFSY